MPAEAYRIEDEPSPGALSHLVVHPLCPLLGFMLGGVWFGWPWFLFNSFAMGSATRRRELILAIIGFIGTVLIVFGLSALVVTGVVKGKVAINLLLVVVTVWKITVSYVLYLWQYRSFEVYEYYGGIVRNGFLIAIAVSFMARSHVLGALPSTFLQLVFR